MAFRLHLLGAATIVSDGGPLGGPVAQRRRVAVLALLAVVAPGGVRRDKLVAHLWPEDDTERARNHLADAVYALRKALGRDAIRSMGDELRLDPAVVQSDVAELAAAEADGELERAAELYQGPFLDGFFVSGAPEFQQWVDATRDRLARQHARTLERLAEGCDVRSDPRGALEWWQRLAAHEPDSSRVALRLVDALERAGDVPAALRHARLHAALLREAMEVDPPPEVLRAIERLRTAPVRAREAPVLADAPPMVSSPPAPPAVTRATPRRRGSRVALMGGVTLAIGLLATLGPYSGRQPAASVVPDMIRSVAVLPLENLSGDADQEFFADGMTDALITELARRGDVRVTSRTSAMRYKGVRRTIPELARELGVDAVVEGTVLQEGHRVRVAARLTRAVGDQHVWGESYERDLREVLPLQAEIARAIAGAIRSRVTHGPVTVPAAPARTVDPRAYSFHLKALHLLNEGAGTHYREAIKLFEQALARAPDFAPAHAGLAEIYVHLDEYQGRSPDGRRARALALASLRRALELDPGLAEAHTSLAHLLMHQEEWQAAEREYRRALELNPNHANARILYAFHLVAQRRFTEAVREAEHAVALDPLSEWTQRFAAYTLFAARRYDAAADRWTRLLELYPSAAGVPWAVARSHLHAGRLDQGLAWTARAAGRSDPADSALVVAYAQAVAGRRDAAGAALAAALRLGGERLDPLTVAMASAWAGDHDQAIAWLERTMEREHGWMMFLDVDAGYDPLRDDSRFQELLRRMRLRS